MEITYKIIDQNTQDLTYLDDICNLMDKIKNANASPYLYPPDREFFIKTCKESFLTVLAFDKDKLVGYKVIKFLEKWPGYLGEIKGFDVEKSTMFLFIIVDTDYRGYKIGQKMNQIGLDEIVKTNRTDAFTTVHPDNIANIKNATKLGFVELERRELFEEKLLRCILHRTT
tara:strand:+ start:28 stop:540 length:513 start_codon:yes stop_codon:yes gene_type:complete